MAKDYLCKSCKENNNGWCNKLKKQGLKQVTSCEYHTDNIKLAIPPVNDMTNIIEVCQQPIKSVPLEERLNDKPKVNKVSDLLGEVNRDTFQEHLKLMQARALIESHYEWRKWAQEIPYIKFPGNWEVKAIPPFGGAIIRYIIKHENSADNSISIYLDCYGELGVVDEPYWELYPDIDGQNWRCGMEDTEELLDRLHEILDRFD